VDPEVALVNGVNAIDRRGHRAQGSGNCAATVDLSEFSGRRERQTVGAERSSDRDIQRRIPTLGGSLVCVLAMTARCRREDN